ncbi:MAG TPA: hypothetical protein VIN06_13480 [Devosia sp.]
MTTESGQAIVISPDTVRKKADEVAALEKKAAAAKQELAAMVTLVRLSGHGDWVTPQIDLIFKTGDSVTLVEFKNLASREGSWTFEIGRVLANADKGLTLSEIKEALQQTHLAERTRTNPNGFYNGVDRLEKAGEVVKYKGRVFATARYEEFMERVKRGEVEDLSGEDDKQTIAAALVDIISRHPNGIVAGDIVAEASKPPISASAASVYNNLSKVYARKLVRRDSGTYYPLNEMGRSQNTESGPETGEVAASPIGSQSSRKLLL